MPSTRLSAGRLNRRVKVMRPKEGLTVDGSGHVDLTNPANWRLVHASRKCNIVPATGREVLIGDQVQAQITHKIDMRFDSESITYSAGYRLELGDRVFNLAGPGQNVNEDNVLLSFPAVEVPTL